MFWSLFCDVSSCMRACASHVHERRNEQSFRVNNNRQHRGRFLCGMSPSVCLRERSGMNCRNGAASPSFSVERRRKRRGTSIGGGSVLPPCGRARGTTLRGALPQARPAPIRPNRLMASDRSGRPARRPRGKRKEATRVICCCCCATICRDGGEEWKGAFSSLRALRGCLQSVNQCACRWWVGAG